MKKLVTTLLLGTVVVGVASEASAQRASERSPRQSAPFIAPPTFAPGFEAAAPQAGKTEVLRYWNDTTENTFTLPGEGETEFNGTTYFERGFMTRFTTSFDPSVARLDSVRILLGVVDVPANYSNGQPNQGISFFLTGEKDEGDGRIFPDFEKGLGGSSFLAPNKLIPEEFNTYKVPFSARRLQVTTDPSPFKGEYVNSFFVFANRFSEENHVVFAFDANIQEPREIDNEVDKTYYFGLNEDATSIVYGYLGGRYQVPDDDASIFYPNLIMEAFVRDPNAVQGVNGTVPNGMRLAQNYPNVFSKFTNINYATPEVGHTSIKVYNNLGQEIATLVDGNMMQGEKTVRFSGENLPNGVYTYVLQWNGHTITKHMTLQR
ncbi:MAG TPA: T9SS type A sorting domain-containing protein [Candidatus Kapabacteria bacterium]|nr:T9SS type A sorting domain-containing protein [Candidatus Kapabacteria bacterium]